MWHTTTTTTTKNKNNNNTHIHIHIHTIHNLPKVICPRFLYRKTRETTSICFQIPKGYGRSADKPLMKIIKIYVDRAILIPMGDVMWLLFFFFYFVLLLLCIFFRFFFFPRIQHRQTRLKELNLWKQIKPFNTHSGWIMIWFWFCDFRCVILRIFDFGFHFHSNTHPHTCELFMWNRMTKKQSKT